MGSLQEDGDDQMTGTVSQFHNSNIVCACVHAAIVAARARPMGDWNICW